ncbi:kinetochore protein nuf2 [Morus notabilis]|uniref:kinetochore protein nuf2 n=1 Tax=Morus notabilis TaxID=981085 RepID=UPI000CECF643|nr:kinetochore protein nuf2 [Morus notabilis]
MSKFEYPRLSRTEIVNVLADYEIVSISERDLLKPTHEFVSELYTRILIYLDFLHEEDHGQVEFDALAQFENPELHMDSVRILKLYNRIKEVVASLECPKRFTLKDVIKPDIDRTEFFLSALLNFCLHKSTKMELLSPMVNELTLIEEQRKKWEFKISELNAVIANHIEAREWELPLVQEVDVKVKELHQTIANLNNHQASLRNTLRKLKEKNGEMDEKISNAEFALVQSVQENANLRSKIVQSPEKLQRALEDKRSVREEATNAERLAMQTFQEKTAISEVYTKVSKKMTKHLAQMQAIQEQVNSAKSVDKDYKALKTKVSDLVVLDKSLDAKLLEWQRREEQLEETVKQSEKERDVRCEKALKEYNRVEMEMELRRRDLEARQKNVEAVVAEVEAINVKTKSVNEAGAAKQQELLTKGEEIVKEFHEYKNSIRNAVPTTDFELKVH